jgi:hypothetical protein
MITMLKGTKMSLIALLTLEMVKDLPLDLMIRLLLFGGQIEKDF